MSGILIYKPLPSEHQMSLGKRNTAGFFHSLQCSLCFPEINKPVVTILFGKIYR